MTDTPATPGAAARREQLRKNLSAVRERINEAAAAAGRSDPVGLVVVTKFHPFSDLVHLAELGVTKVGENRLQEAQAKAAEWAEAVAADPALRRPALHMIGHIQSKKTGAVARIADMVESVDSVKVADGLSRGRVREIDEHGAAPLPCLVQLSLDGDTARGGVPLAQAEALADHVAAADGLELAGVMVVPPLHGEPAAHFARAAAVWAQIRAGHPEATTFSAGMSGDLEDAIAAGSTLVRVGTAIMGPRPIP